MALRDILEAITEGFRNLNEKLKSIDKSLAKIAGSVDLHGCFVVKTFKGRNE